MVTHQEVDDYQMTELILWSSTRLKRPFSFSAFVSERPQYASNNIMMTFTRQGLRCTKPVHRSPHTILGSKSDPSRIGNRVEENALLGETLWLALQYNG
jgi:hypothetical protein